MASARASSSGGSAGSQRHDMQIEAEPADADAAHVQQQPQHHSPPDSSSSPPSSLPFSSAHVSVSGVRDAAASPTSLKRHITTVLNPYTQNHRVSAPSPPKSPIRSRALFTNEAASPTDSAVGASGAAVSPVSSPLKRPSSLGGNAGGGDPYHSNVEHSPTRSPVRIASSAVARERSCPTTPTRSMAPHGLPASPHTPSRARPTHGASSSASPPLHGTRSPIGAFWFPHGIPASPLTKQRTQTTLAQLTALHPHGFDSDVIEQLTVEVIKLPKYLACYVQQQCLLIQQNKRELQTAVRENRARELSKQRIHRHMQRLRRDSGSADRSASQRSSMGQLSAAIKDATLDSPSDMSLDGSAGGAADISGGLAVTVDDSQSELSSPHPLPASALSTMQSSLLSPTSAAALASMSRGRNDSSTSTSSSVVTQLTFPGASAPNSPAHAQQQDETPPEALLSPLSISNRDRSMSRGASPNASLLNVSGMDDSSATAAPAGVDPADDVDGFAVSHILAASEVETRVLPATFQYYFQNHLEKFKDPTTRFFRVLHSSIEYLLDAPTPSPTLNDEGQVSATSSAAAANAAAAAAVTSTAPSTPGRHAHHQPHSSSSRIAPPLHIPSPRSSSSSSPSAAASMSPILPLHPQSSLSSLSVPALPPSSSTAYLTRSHFQPLLDSILSTHPGLQFLVATPEFQSKYAQTCIERVFFNLDSRGAGKLTLADIRRSTLLDELAKLADDPDINKSSTFSYQHFYVLYCKFWELDSPDHDGFLSLSNLLEYENRSLSTRICERIMDTCTVKNLTQPTATTTEGEEGGEAGGEAPAPASTTEADEGATPQSSNVAAAAAAAAASASSSTSDVDGAGDADSEFPASERVLSSADLHTPRMEYSEFIPFMLAEVDKNTAPSLRYWFDKLDLDHDHVLSLFELDHFFSEQVEKIQALSSDIIRWNDIVCQLLDMIKGGGSATNQQGAAAGQQHQRGALTSASAAMARDPVDAAALMAPSSISLRPPAPLSASSLAFEFSSCHITRKDLARSHLQSYFLNLFFNLPRFLTHESRDPHKARAAHEAQENGVSEWETYATAMYSALVANEELQARAAEQHQHPMTDEEEEEQQQHMDDGEVAATNEQLCEEEDTGMNGNCQCDDRQQEGGDEHTHYPAVVRRSASRQEGAVSRQEHHDEHAQDIDMQHGGDGSDASSHAYNAALVESRDFMRRRWGIGSRTATVTSPVQVLTGDGAAPHCFFVQDEVEVEVCSPSPPRHAQMPAAAAMMLAQAQQEHQHATQPDAAATAAAAAAARQRRREEERAFLELQRKIHSSDDDADEEHTPILTQTQRPQRSTSWEHQTEDEEEEEEAVSPSASHHSMGTHQTASTGGSPMLARMQLHSPHVPAVTRSPQQVASSSSSSSCAVSPSSPSSPDVTSSSVSPPSLTGVSRRASPSGKTASSSSSPTSPHEPVIKSTHGGKENADFSSAHSHASGSGTGFKRQLFTATDKTPLSPAQPNRQW